MKNFFTISACIVLLIQGCQSPNSQRVKSAGTDSAFIITGKISGLDSGLVYLFNRQSDADKLDSVLITNGTFSFTGKADSPEFFPLGVPNNGHKEYRLGFFVQNGQINITGRKDSLSDAIITGSAAQDEYKSFLAGQKPLDEEETKLGKL